MRFRIGTLAAIIVAGVVGAAAVTAGAADDPATVLKNRQEAMKGFGGHMKAINDALEAGTDLSGITEHAAALRDGAKSIPDWFPAGTGIDDGVGKTAAKQEIWAEWDKFAAAAKTLETEAGELVDVAAGGDAAAIGAAFGEVGKNGCGGCHSSFRQKTE